MAEVVRASREKSLQMAGVIAGTVFTFNALFFIASRFYYADKPNELADVGSVRFAFAVLTVVIAGMAYIAALAPRIIGHGLAVLIGVATLVGSIAAFSKGLPPVMGVTMLVVGGLLPVLTWKSWHHSRAAWAFLIALVVVFGNVTFFGAPKVRSLLGIGLWYALLAPGLKAVCVIALAMVRDEYRE